MDCVYIHQESAFTHSVTKRVGDRRLRLLERSYVQKAVTTMA